MKKTREEKLNILKQYSRLKTGKSKWKEIAEWNQDHAESLEDQVRIATRILQALESKNMTDSERMGEKTECHPDCERQTKPDLTNHP